MYCAILFGMNFLSKFVNIGDKKTIPHTQATDIKKPASKAVSGLKTRMIIPDSPSALRAS